MTTDFRALCAELLDEFVYHTDWSDAEELKERARAALADEPAAGEPASAVGEPSDGELNRLLWHEFTTSTGHGERTDPIAFARAVLARWGNLAPQPPAEGEVAELVALLRAEAKDDMLILTPADLLRAAELLQRLSPPQPVPVSERLPGPGEMTEDGEVWVDDPGHDYPIADSGDYDWEPHKWIMRPISRFDAKYGRHWLPAHALPLPGQEVEG